VQLHCENSPILTDSTGRPLRDCQGSHADTGVTILTHRDGRVLLVGRHWPVAPAALASTMALLDSSLTKRYGGAHNCDNDDAIARNVLAWHLDGVTITAYDIHRAGFVGAGVSQRVGPMACGPR
jgi:hypothetical protein